VFFIVNHPYVLSIVINFTEDLHGCVLCSLNP
jgi:hypothetical protein